MSETVDQREVIEAGAALTGPAASTDAPPAPELEYDLRGFENVRLGDDAGLQGIFRDVDNYLASGGAYDFSFVGSGFWLLICAAVAALVFSIGAARIAERVTGAGGGMSPAAKLMGVGIQGLWNTGATAALAASHLVRGSAPAARLAAGRARERLSRRGRTDSGERVDPAGFGRRKSPDDGGWRTAGQTAAAGATAAQVQTKPNEPKEPSRFDADRYDDGSPPAIDTDALRDATDADDEGVPDKDDDL